MRCLASFLVFLLLALALALPSHAQRRISSLPKEANQAAGWKILQSYRDWGLGSDAQLRFQLKILPRRGKSSYVTGMMLMSNSQLGPVSRMDIIEEKERLDEAGSLVPARTLRLLLQNGPESFAWISGEGERETPALAADGEYFEPLAGTEITLFDLLMPFQFWKRFLYQGTAEIRGRETHVFWVYPPDNDQRYEGKLYGVRLFIDGQFKAMREAEIYASEQELIKTLSIESFKKVDGSWIVGAVDLRNEATRDKTRFKVIDATIGPRLARNLFLPSALGESIIGQLVVEGESLAMP